MEQTEECSKKVKVGVKGVWKILKQSFSNFSDLNILKMSAALAYYTIFSIAPMIIVIITLCDIFYGREAIEGSIYGEISNFVGPQAAEQIQSIIRNATISSDITWASVIGICTLLFAATGVFAEIQDSINHIWHIKAKPKTSIKKGLIKMALNRLLSFSLVVSLGFILLVSLVINALMETLGNRLEAAIGETYIYIAYGLNILITFGVITFLFAIIFKVLPDARIRWRNVIAGAMTTAVLFMLGKFAISFYLTKSNISSTYGAAGSIVILLLWVYYSAIILYFGAIYTYVFAQYTGCEIKPNSYAVFVKQVELESKKPLNELSETKKAQEEMEVPPAEPEDDTQQTTDNS